MAMMRKASSPSRSVMTNAWSIMRTGLELRLNLRMSKRVYRLISDQSSLQSQSCAKLEPMGFQNGSKADRRHGGTDIRHQARKLALAIALGAMVYLSLPAPMRA